MSRVHSRKEEDLKLVIEELRKGTKLLANKIREKDNEIIKLNAKIIKLERQND